MTPQQDFELLRIRMLRAYYAAGHMDVGTLRMRLELYGYVEPFISIEVSQCEDVRIQYERYR